MYNNFLNYPKCITPGYKNKGREVNKASNVANQDSSKLSSFVWCVIWFQVFQSKTNIFQTDLFYS